MDELVKKIAALGVPGLVLLILMSVSGASGAAALTAALSMLGPFGMIGGIAVLGIISVSSDKITEFGIEKVANAVVKEQLKTKNINELLDKVNKYPISKGMKLKILEFIKNSATSNIQ